MTFTYDGDPAATDLEWVRFELGDTASATPLFTDEEINAILGAQANKYLAAARLWSNLLGRWAGAGRGILRKRVDELDKTFGTNGESAKAIMGRISELRSLGMPSPGFLKAI